MIDSFRRVARRIQILRLPSIVVGLVCLTSIVVILVASGSRAEDRMLMPSFVGLLWATSLYSFIESFCWAPERLVEKQGFIRDLKYRIRRGWYWIRGFIFLASTAIALVITSRMVSIWLAEYSG